MISKMLAGKKHFTKVVLKRFQLFNSDNGSFELREKEVVVEQALRSNNKQLTKKFLFTDSRNSGYDYIIIGAGHNGLVCANYLGMNGKKVLVVERRHTVGGAAVTEELVEGYHFSRCSYLLSVFRKKVINELFEGDIHKYLTLYKRSPGGFLPTQRTGDYIIKYPDSGRYKVEIAKHSYKDQENIDELDSYLKEMVEVLNPILDIPPPTISIFDRNFWKFCWVLLQNRRNILKFFHIIFSDAQSILDKYLECDLLKGAYATDSVIGNMISPKSKGSGCVLLHHVMGEIDDDGSWFIVKGGNGAVSEVLAKKALDNNVDILLSTEIKEIIINNQGEVSEYLPI